MTAAARRDRARELLARVGLEEARNLPLRRYSKGMTQRVGLAQALMNDPELVFLDEPMSGLDPLGRRLVRRIILDLKAAGKTVLLLHPHPRRRREPLRPGGAAARGEAAAGGRARRDPHHRRLPPRGPGGRPRGGGRGGLRADRAARASASAGRLEVEEQGLGEIVRAVEAAGGRILGVQPVRQSLEEFFVARDGRPGRPDGVGLTRVLAVAANTFRETVRERVLYNLVFFAILMTAVPASSSASSRSARTRRSSRTSAWRPWSCSAP